MADAYAAQCIALTEELADVYTVDTDQVRLIGLVQKAKAIKASASKKVERSER